MPRRLFRRSASSLLLAVVATYSISGRADPPPVPAARASPAPASGPTAPAFPCGPAVHLSTAQQLLAALHTQWPRPGIGLSPVTVELIADVDLVAQADALPGPAYCTARCTHEHRKVSCKGTGDPCRTPVRFRVNNPVAGVKVDGQAVATEGLRLQVKAGTHFRLRQRVHEFHPETPYYDPVITAEPACEVACAAGELRCPATGLCTPTQNDSYCLACRGLSRQECACSTPEGLAKPEGTICTFLSGDYFPTGTCKQGRCEMKR